MRVAELGTAASVDAILAASGNPAPILSTPMAHRTKPHQTGATKGNVRAFSAPSPFSICHLPWFHKVQQVRNKVKRA
jgi:hypothetical protein